MDLETPDINLDIKELKYNIIFLTAKDYMTAMYDKQPTYLEMKRMLQNDLVQDIFIQYIRHNGYMNGTQVDYIKAVMEEKLEEIS